MDLDVVIECFTAKMAAEFLLLLACIDADDPEAPSHW